MINPNPASAKSFDRYAYAYNNPLYYTDPSGHIPELECGFSHGSCGINSMKGYTPYHRLTHRPPHGNPARRTGSSAVQEEVEENQTVYEEVIEILGHTDPSYVDPMGKTDVWIDNKVVEEAIDDIYGGYDNLHNAAMNCLVNRTNDACSNPFWDNLGNNPDYESFARGRTISNANNMFMKQFLGLLNAVPAIDQPLDGNYAPIWLETLMNVSRGPELALIAAEITLNKYEFSVHGADIEFIEWLTSTKVQGIP